MRIEASRRAICLIAAWLLSGCAALTVDVDVYKGPLANDPSLQTEQVIWLAKASKEPLFELRSRMEFSERLRRRRLVSSQSTLTAAAFERHCLVEQQKLEIKDPDCDELRQVQISREYINEADELIQSPEARRINALLRRFENQSGANIDPKLRGAIKSLSRAVGRVSERVYAKDEKAYKPEVASQKIATLITQQKEPPKTHPNAEVDYSNVNSLELVKRLKPLAAAIQGAPEKDKSLRTKDFQAQLDALSPREKIALRDQISPTDPGVIHDKSLVEAFGFLLSAELKFFAALVQEEDRTALGAKRIDAFAQSLLDDFLSADALRASLLGKLGVSKDTIDKECVTGNLELSQLLMQSPQLSRDEMIKPQSPVSREIKQRMKQQLNAATGYNVAKGLLCIHDKVRDPNSAYRAAGIAQVPNFSKGTETPDGTYSYKDLDVFVSQVRRLEQKLADFSVDSLDPGSPESGLNARFSAYYDVHKRDPRKKKKEEVKASEDSELDPVKAAAYAKEVEKQLQDDLVGFATAMLVIANNDALLRDAGEDVVSKKFVRVLQAIGNSILSQVDATRKYTQHYDDGAAKVQVQRQIQALMQAEAKQRQLDLAKIKSEIEKESPALLKSKDTLIAATGKSRDDLADLLKALEQSAGETEQSLAEANNGVQAVAFLLARTTVPVKEWIDAIESAKDAGDVTTPPLVKRSAAFAKIVALLDKARTDALSAGRVDEASDLSRSIKAFEICRDGDEKVPARQILADWTVKLKNAESLSAKTRDERAAVAGRVGMWKLAVGDLQSRARILPLGTNWLEEQARGTKPALNDPKSVMDLVLSTYRYEHVAAVRNGDAEDAKRLEDAISTMEGYRSQLIYIRPAMIFLRNSYPASALQQDSSSIWNNLLDQQAMRSVPGYSPGEDALLQAGIDKQYWQSVNRIRVAGAGNTNYAVVKDDVGNWYVKNYSSDPKQIIDSIKGLSLLGIGRSTSSYLLDGLGADASPAGAQGGTPSLTNKQQRSTLEAQYDKHVMHYYADIVAVHQGLRNDLLSSPGAFVASTRNAAQAGAADNSPLRTQEATLFPEIKVAYPKNEALINIPERSGKYSKTPTSTQVREDVRTVEKEIDQMLRSALQYAQDSGKRIDGQVGKSNGTGSALVQGDADNAKKAVTRLATDLAESRVQQLRRANEFYEQALLITGDSAGIGAR